jgi:hypothetical protein
MTDGLPGVPCSLPEYRQPRRQRWGIGSHRQPGENCFSRSNCHLWRNLPGLADGKKEGKMGSGMKLGNRLEFEEMDSSDESRMGLR